MEQIRTFSDSKIDGHCIYWGNEPDSRERVPSKILLDKPYPEYLPIVSACTECNQGFFLDEEYLACLLECTLCGTTEPDLLHPGWAHEQINDYKNQKDSMDDGYAKLAWVISTANTEDCCDLAKSNCVLLINGNQFGKMLLEAGISNFDDAF